MRVITTETRVFKYDELDDKAKERAFDKWSEAQGRDFFTEFVYEDARRMGEILGIEIDNRTSKTYGGGTRSDPSIWWSGFSCQGDGACFDGTYRYAKGSAKAIREEAPQDETLQGIADRLEAVQKPCMYQLRAKVKQSGHYNHSGCTDIEVWDDRDQYRDIGDAEDEIKRCLRDFMDWIYKRLEAEYDYQTSEESFEAYIADYEPEFTEFGTEVHD